MIAPPGALILVLAYGAGLLTGLSRFLDPVIVIPLLSAAAWVLRRSVATFGVVALLLGILVGHRARRNAGSECAAALRPGDQELVVRTVESGIHTGRVRLPDRRCRGELMARWPATARIGAGHLATVRARWLSRPASLGRSEGLLVVARVLKVTGTPSLIDSLRSQLVTISTTLYGTQSPLVDALITGRRGGIDTELVQAFASAGLVHLLAISGSHIAVIAGWVLLLSRSLRVGRHTSEAIAVVAAIGYTAFIGWPPSALRAASLLALVAYCRWRQRNVRSDALLAASALLVLWYNPWALVDIGAWLSVLALAGVSGATRWSDRAIGTGAMVRILSGSIGATLATAPLTAFAFGQVAPIGILLNLVAVPLTAILVPVLLLSLLLFHPLHAVAMSLATSGSLLLKGLAFIARVGASAPGAAGGGTGGWQDALPWLAALGVALWVTSGRTTAREATRRLTWAGTLAIWLVLIPLGGASTRIEGRGLTLLFVDVGQGDAALIRTPGGHWFAVDAGPVDLSGRDAGRRVLLPLLARERVRRIEAFVLSHAHRDHVGGARALIEGLTVGAVVDPGQLFDDSAYDSLLGALPSRKTRWHPVRSGAEWTVDGVRFVVLHPPRAWAPQGEDLNEDSAVLQVSYGDFSALLMGDAGFVAESAMAAQLEATNLLKVGHHGSRGATGEKFLAVVSPQVGIISVGRNRYGHPAPETLERLAHAGVRVWRTDREGTTSVTTDGNTFTVYGGRTTATFAARARIGPRRRRAGTPPRTDQGHHPGALHPRTGAGSPRSHGRTHQPAL